MDQKITQVDAFTDSPFGGNPAAVCVLPGPGKAEWMQLVAREMNLAETAFLYRRGDGFSLRWFTPSVEVDLCGHATLASAHVLWEEGYLPVAQQALFHTRSGVLTADRRGRWIEMDFPATPAQAVAKTPKELTKGLGVELKYVGQSQFDYLVEVDSEETLRALKPDLTMLAKLPVRGVIVTSRSTAEEFDFVSRFFAPQSGVPEDPVTGSAHCTLGPFWGERLGKKEMRAYQASERGGVVWVRTEAERVMLRGQAITTLRCELIV